MEGLFNSSLHTIPIQLVHFLIVDRTGKLVGDRLKYTAGHFPPTTYSVLFLRVWHCFCRQVNASGIYINKTCEVERKYFCVLCRRFDGNRVWFSRWTCFFDGRFAATVMSVTVLSRIMGFFFWFQYRTPVLSFLRFLFHSCYMCRLM